MIIVSDRVREALGLLEQLEADDLHSVADWLDDDALLFQKESGISNDPKDERIMATSAALAVLCRVLADERQQ